jgi:hypothetical protein
MKTDYVLLVDKGKNYEKINVLPSVTVFNKIRMACLFPNTPRTLNSASFDTHNPHIMKKKLNPYILLDPEKNDLSSTGHLTK